MTSLNKMSVTDRFTTLVEAGAAAIALGLTTREEFDNAFKDVKASDPKFYTVLEGIVDIMVDDFKADPTSALLVGFKFMASRGL